MKPPTHIVTAQRKKLLDAARYLARSGCHTDHRSIFAQIETMDGFSDARDRLQVIRSQIDHLCALAKPGRARIDIPGRQRPENDCCTE
jgi:hypothetical protein